MVTRAFRLYEEQKTKRRSGGVIASTVAIDGEREGERWRKNDGAGVA